MLSHFEFMIFPPDSNKSALEEVTSDNLVISSSGCLLGFIYGTFVASATHPHILPESRCPPTTALMHRLLVSLYFWEGLS